MTDNPFLRRGKSEGQRIHDESRVGDRITIRHHSQGYGLGCEYRETTTSGKVHDKTPGAIIIENDRGVLSYIPVVWIDELIEKEEVHG